MPGNTVYQNFGEFGYNTFLLILMEMQHQYPHFMAFDKILINKLTDGKMDGQTSARLNELPLISQEIITTS